MQILSWNQSNLHESHILKIVRGFLFCISPVMACLPFKSPPWSASMEFVNDTRFSSPATAMAVDEESRFHVLAVDDSLIDRKLIEALLRVSSYRVDSGTEALKLLGLQEESKELDNSPASGAHGNREIDVNLIITDYFMPGMTGYDLLRRIKDSECCKDIPVVIMSSENVPSRISRCLEDGAEEFLLKPVRLSDVSKLRPHLLKGRCKERAEEIDGNM